MHRQSHGEEPTTNHLEKHDMSFDPDAMTPFRYFHGDPDNNGLDPSPATVRALDELGLAMVDQNGPDEFAPGQSPDSSIPPIYTYWSQFIDHEMTARTGSNEGLSVISDPPDVLHPVPSDEIVKGLHNRRTPNFDLDALYGSITNPTDPVRRSYQENFARALRDPIDSSRMRVGMNTVVNFSDIPPSNAIADKRDLPRLGQIDAATLESLTDPDIGAAGKTFALIGDSRNDENLLVAQFHTAMLHFHNAVVDWLRAHDPIDGESNDDLFERARKTVRWTFQWLVVNDFMARILEPSVVGEVMADRAQRYMQRSPDGKPYTPLEFSTAAYRFGHSMIRNAYDYNRNFGRGAGVRDRATLVDLFRFTGKGPFPFPAGAESLASNWIVEWDRFTGDMPMDDGDGLPARLARAIDTKLAPPLSHLTNEGKDVQSGFDSRDLMKHLARRNLRRGYVLSIPTGQAMAEHFGLTPLNEGELRRDMSLHVQYVLERGGFLQKTPLWFYILREAEINGGDRLGLLGSYMVAETFVGALLLDPNSYLRQDATWHPGRAIPGANRQPIFGQANNMRIGDLLRFAGVL